MVRGKKRHLCGNTFRHAHAQRKFTHRCVKTWTTSLARQNLSFSFSFPAWAPPSVPPWSRPAPGGGGPEGEGAQASSFSAHVDEGTKEGGREEAVGWLWGTEHGQQHDEDGDTKLQRTELSAFLPSLPLPVASLPLEGAFDFGAKDGLTQVPGLNRNRRRRDQGVCLWGGREGGRAGGRAEEDT
jgi:hypothetical protein